MVGLSSNWQLPSHNDFHIIYLFWNCNGFSEDTLILISSICDRYHILAVCESWLKPNSVFNSKPQFFL